MSASLGRGTTTSEAGTEAGNRPGVAATGPGFRNHRRYSDKEDRSWIHLTPVLPLRNHWLFRRIPSTGCVPIVDCPGISDNRVGCRGGLSSECAGGGGSTFCRALQIFSGMTTYFMAISKAVPSSHLEFHDNLETETHADVVIAQARCQDGATSGAWNYIASHNVIVPLSQIFNPVRRRNRRCRI